MAGMQGLSSELAANPELARASQTDRRTLTVRS